MDSASLRRFVVAAHREGYATGAAEREADGTAKRLTYEDGPFRYVDRYHGSRSFAGRESVLQEGTPVWSMHYHGAPTRESVDHGRLYEFLRTELAAVSHEHPYRGPPTYEADGFRYRAETTGDFGRFSGTETVRDGSGVLYRGRYGGCLLE